jgi:hypothetical protein
LRKIEKKSTGFYLNPLTIKSLLPAILAYHVFLNSPGSRKSVLLFGVAYGRPKAEGKLFLFPDTQKNQPGRKRCATVTLLAVYLSSIFCYQAKFLHDLL